ncbi:hypothetical protein [Effusibacillus consociatus]|uniref:Uncharacterized protein n=1 Tax=Effusibacillus consociatus TaxID=1117041 RepID=A0ABV9PZC3_9BACL
MSVFLLEILAILIFIKWADLTRIRELFPLVLTGVYARFLEHYIIVDWLHIWKVHGSKWMDLWIPITADLTVWPVICYLFVQFLPEKRRWLYGGMFVAIMYTYLQILLWRDVYSIKQGWNLWISPVGDSLYFLLIYLTWRWLRQSQKVQTNQKKYKVS